MLISFTHKVLMLLDDYARSIFVQNVETRRIDGQGLDFQGF